MFLEELELVNFRNYTHLNLNLNNSKVIFIGDNGQGKTNLLESIYFLSSGKSHRTYNPCELINWNFNYSIIRGLLNEKNDFNSKNSLRLIELEIRENNPLKVRVDKEYIRKKSSFISVLPSVFFGPDDLKIIKESPSNRRNFLDNILERTYDDYSFIRNKYQKILNQRNSLLKSADGSANIKNNSTLEVWDHSLVKYGIKILEKRLLLVQEIEDKFLEYMEYFFNNIKIDISYIFSWEREGINSIKGVEKESIDCIKKDFYNNLKKNLLRDLSFKMTTIGPHRDDILFSFKGKNLRLFGSQGQQRIGSLSLKLCEVILLKEKLKKNPLLLLDDVLSELDIERKKLLVKLIDNKFQTFITTTNISYINSIAANFGKKFLVKNNKIKSF